VPADAMRYTAVLLDIDGTIIDSNDAHAQAWLEAFRRYSLAVDYRAIRSRIGKGGDKLLAELAGLDSESGKGRDIAEARTHIFKAEFLPTLKPTPGARAMLEWVRREGTTVTVATSATSDEVGDLLRQADVEDLIDTSANSDDAENSKPDPDIVVAALHKSGAARDHAIMIGDTPYDVAAAKAAGIASVAFRCGGWADSDLQGANAVYDDPADLLTNLAHSPFAPTSQ
jgi:HAD superfamily hydrolase (TIGR01509 family)